MAKDADKIVVASNGSVYSGIVGSTPPSNFASALDAAFIDMGYVSDAGLEVVIGREVLEIPAWNSPETVRTVVTGRSITVAFNLMEWKELTVELATDGVSAGAPSEWTVTQPDADDVNSYAMVFEWEDGSSGFRLYLPRAVKTDDTTFTLNRKDFAGLPVTMKGLIDADTDYSWKLFSSHAGLEESTE